MTNQEQWVKELRRSLEPEPPTLPPDLLELREPDIAEVLNPGISHDAQGLSP
jgi:hypothetical protein